MMLDKVKSALPNYKILVKAPGRANIIGEHVDYCEGLVLPFAISQSLFFAAKLNATRIVNVHSLNMDESFSIDTQIPFETEDRSGWHNYFSQIISCLKRKGHPVSGVDIVFGSEIPIGAGVSSSSAICCGFVFLLDALFKLDIPIKEQILIASEAEHGMGLKGGLMDQYTIFNGSEGKALLMDCKTNTHEEIKIVMGDHSFVLLNSKVKHSLVDSEYNNRREEVENALACIQKDQPETTFRNLKLKDIPNSIESDRRLHHVISEIQRVKDATEHIQDKNFTALGHLLKASHESLRDDYEVSCEEIDFLVSEINAFDGVRGCRMMGGGFGGSIIALLDASFKNSDWEILSNKYYSKYSLKPDVIAIKASKGIELLETRN